MKKLFLSIAFLSVIFTAKAFQLPAPQSNPPHIELKYYGLYCVVDFTHMMHFKAQNGQYMDQFGNLHAFDDVYGLNGITAVAGWQWRKESAIGLGFSYLSDPMGAFSQIPVFVEFRSHFLRNRLTPYTAVQMGYSIPFGSKNKVLEYTRIAEGGITFGLQAGLRFAFSRRFGINAYVGYQFIQCRDVERGFEEVATSSWPEIYHNLKFGTGFYF